MTTATLNVNRLPWSDNMIEVAEGATSEQMLLAAGLDWTVEFQPLYRRPSYVPVTSREPETNNEITVLAPNIGGEYHEAPDIKDVVRVPDGKTLGQVRKTYKITQNHEAYAFADHLVHTEGGRWVAAGEQYGGRVVFGVMQLQQGTVMIGNEDPVGLYLIIRTSHDGSTGIQLILTPVRLQCENMMPAAIGRSKARWTMRHVSTLDGRLQNARETLQISLKGMDAFQRQMEELLQVPVTDQKAEWVLDRIMPKWARRDHHINGIIRATHDDQLNGYAGTGYGLVNGLTDYFDHTIKRRSGAIRFSHQLEGDGAKMRTALVQELLHA